MPIHPAFLFAGALWTLLGFLVAAFCRVARDPEDASPSPAASTPIRPDAGQGRLCPGAHHSAHFHADAPSNRTCAAGEPLHSGGVGICTDCGTVIVGYHDGAARCACGASDLAATTVRAREAHEFTAALAEIRGLPERVPAHERQGS